ncbi:hypothetical protein [Desulfonatronum thioautotrophicum]|uniref:hypothetical protein n=1 Tax=Desulfonatronum thioautotrophicum TaxID=617001 RepID=UPI0005EB39D3|nr:hypothetical protein [Desulfonatronum thioautotrophicum]
MTTTRQISVKSHLLRIAGLVCLISSVLAGLIFAYAARDMTLRKADARLHSAAEFLNELLGAEFHDRIMDADSIPGEEFQRDLDRNDDLCRRLGLQYLWSVLVLDDRIVFTSATRTCLGDPASTHASFFETHRDPGAFAGAMGEVGLPVYSSFHNEWGEGRMVLVPRLDAR